MKILKPNTPVRLESWNHVTSASFSTVRAYALQYGENPDAAFTRAMERKHETAWANYAGSCIDNTGHSHARDKAQAMLAVTLQDGEVVAIDGEPEVYRVKVTRHCHARPIYSDPISFEMLTGMDAQVACEHLVGTL